MPSLAVASLICGACATAAPEPLGTPPAGPSDAPIVHLAPPPSEAEPYCAWYADRRGDFLFVGAAPFWPALRTSGGDPRADARTPGPALIERFDLAEERFLAPLRVAEGEPSGVWDVLAHPDGALYFTTFFGAAGRVDPMSGAVERFPDAGTGLAELAPGPEGSVLAARYAEPGSVVLLSEHGVVLAEHRLEPVAGHRVAAKSVAYDASRDEIWALTDLLPEDEALPVAHDARVIDARTGAERQRLSASEVQFVVFEADGTGYAAEVRGGALRLVEIPPGVGAAALAEGAAHPAAGVEARLLDPRFPAAADFAQEVRVESDGRVVVTRWSGIVHVVAPDGRVGTRRLPRGPEGLFYTGVARAGRVCATRCEGVSVVCAPAP